MPQFSGPLAFVVGLVSVLLLIGIVGFLAAFTATMVRTGLQDWRRRRKRGVSRWRPPEDYTQAEIEERREHIHPAWTPPTVPGQCPICGAMPDEHCDVGLHC